MSDLISREMAIGVVGRRCGMCIQGILDIPAAQPDSKESSSTHKALDLIDRQAAIEAILSRTNCKSVRDLYEYNAEHDLHMMWTGGIVDAIDMVIGVPAAEPGIDEWCTDCSEYDHERHCCPRWNRVIRETLKDAQSEQTKMIKEIRKWINSGNRGSADYFIVDKIEEIINKYE